MSSDVVDVYDLPEDEPELVVVINKFFPDKFALISLNCIVVVVLTVVVESLSVVVESLSVVVESLSVVVVEEELSLDVEAPSSLLLQEMMMVRLKSKISNMCKISFIFP